MTADIDLALAKRQVEQMNAHLDNAQRALREARAAMAAVRLPARGATYRRIEAACRMLQDEGHMTPVATRQILRALSAELGVVDDDAAAAVSG